MQLERIIHAYDDHVDMSVLFDVDQDDEQDEVLEDEVVEKKHFNFSQALSTVLTSNFKNIVVV